MSSNNIITSQNLIAYVDETGDSQNKKFVGMGGLISTQAKWELLRLEWQNALNDYGLPYFHMVEYAHSSGVFRVWKGSENRRKSMLGCFLKIIQDINPIPFGAMLIVSDFNLLTKDQKNVFCGHYDTVFQDAINQALYVTAVDHNNMYAGRTPVEFRFEHKAGIENRARHVFNRFQTIPNMKERLASIHFPSTQEDVAVQAADLVAYEIFKYFSDRRNTAYKHRYGFKVLHNMALGHKEYIWVHPYDRKRLEEVANLSIQAKQAKSNPTQPSTF